jgi:hypothetical protein
MPSNVNKPPTPAPLLTLRRVLIAATIAGCAALFGTVVARFLLAASHGMAPWVLPAAVVGALAVVLICALIFLPLLSRRA